MAQIGLYAVPVFLLSIFVMAFIKNTNAFDDFVEGAKEGLGTAASLLPNLVGMIVGVKVFLASGILDSISAMLDPLLSRINLHPQLLPLMILRPLSGSATVGYASELINIHGPDSLVGRLASVMQASSDTTIYIITVYFAAVGLKEMKHALKLGLITDLFAFGLAIVAVSLFF
ncbi:MAG: spore maturation protein [Turicibacter sp.]|nr:spore maturation protein [Turicibacter sp.]